MRLMPDCEYDSVRAARVRLPCRTASTNARYLVMLDSIVAPSPPQTFSSLLGTSRQAFDFVMPCMRIIRF